MRTWHTLLGERLELYSPIGLRLIDAFTGAAPIGQIRPFLDVSDGSGGWRPTEIKAVRTPSHVLIYPGLERRAEVIGQPPRRYRVQIEAEGYRPFYRMTLEGRRFNGPPFYRETATGIEFDAFPYNDMMPPQFTITESFEITERSLEELRKRLEEEKVPDKVAKIRTALSAASDTAELDDVTKLEKDDIVSINSTEYTIQSVTKDDSANSGKITVTPQLPAGTAANTDVKKLSISTKDVDQLLEMLEQLINQEVMGEESFLDLLRRTIGDEQMVRFKSFIVETAFVAQPGTVLLAPAVNYPFPTHVPVLRGVVVDQSGVPVVDADVSWKNKEQVLTGERGEFGLPLRLTEENEKTDPQDIDAMDHRTGRTGTITIQLPQALRSSQKITIS